MFTKFIKLNLLDNYYVGYRVRKSISIKKEVVFGLTKTDVFEITYLNEGLTLFTAKEAGKFYDVDKEVIVGIVETKQIATKHLAYGNENYDINDYPSYSKEKLFGVYGVRPLRAVYTSLFEENYEVLVSNKKEQGTLRNDYSIFEAQQLVKKCNKILGNTNNILTIPPVKLDLHDPIKSVFGFEKDFDILVDNKTPEQVIAIMKLKVKEHEHGNL